MKTKCLLYCTKDKNLLRKVVEYDESSMAWYQPHYEIINDKNCDFDILNGKVVAECEVEVENLYEYQVDGYGSEYEIASDTLKQEQLLKECCLTYDQLNDYLGDINNGYALHISNLKVFDKPLELSEVYHYTKTRDTVKGYVYGCEELTKAPQNMMWVWYKGERYCLISIRPQWLCKELNGEKPVEVRKQVLKDMIKENRKVELL